MLKSFLRRPSNAFLIAVCIVLAIALVSVLSLPFKQLSEINTEASEYWTIFGHHLKITDTLLVLFTFTLWWATRDLVKGAEATAERELRAYISVEPGQTFRQSKKRNLGLSFVLMS